jgi:uncharacterized protein (TIGR03382 family)
VRRKEDGLEAAFKVSLDESNAERSPLERLWARARIAGLERSEHWNGSLADNRPGLALEHRLLTQYTSFVAIDTMSAGPMAATRITQPNEAPMGVSLNAAGGTQVTGAGAVTTQALPQSPGRYEESSGGDKQGAAEIEAVHSRGGCAGCSTTTPARGASQAVILGLLVLGAHRRRRR